MEQTFSFTVKLSQQTYVLLREESKKREGENGAVPSRTARQLIEERLENISLKGKVICTTGSRDVGDPVYIDKQPTATEEDDKPKQNIKKSRSRKSGVDADESTPTT